MMKKSDKWRVISGKRREVQSHHSSLITHHCVAFTLLELLVVISILGILAGLAVPALKNIGKSNITDSASRQLLDDIGHARQLAMSRRTTVYMVFVPTNFWMVSGTFNSSWMNSLSASASIAATNMCDNQMTGYIFVSRGTVGDQPGQHRWHYLAPAQNLPAGTFIAQQKFIYQPNQFYAINDPVSGAVLFDVYGFNVTNSIPFPTETNTASPPYLPYIAFNYLGQLTFDGQNLAGRDEYIPLAQGGVSPAIDPATKTLLLNANSSSQVSEIPPGNSTNISYNVVHIDALTGRAVLEFYKIGQ